MMELVIKGQVYQFKFGMGFMRAVNKLLQKPIDGIDNKNQNVGLTYMVAGVIDGDLEMLIDMLLYANAGQSPQVTKSDLDDYIDTECEDIDQLFEDVMGFLKTANATKKVTIQMLEAVEIQKAKAANQ